MEAVFAREPLPQRPSDSIFLAGPTPRQRPGSGALLRTWRSDALDYLKDFPGYVFVPEDRRKPYPAIPGAEYIPPFPDNDVKVWDEQVEWELAGLAQANVILFWVPRKMESHPGLTTNIEWGQWHNSERAILGFPHGADGMRYMYKQAWGIQPSDADTTLRKLCDRAVGKLGADRELEDCVFCRIVHQDPEGQIEWWGTDSVVITPRDPVVEGHKLVIPRKHAVDSLDYPSLTGRVATDAANYCNEHYLQEHNLITSCGSVATQTIFHLHWHIVPRQKNDGLTLPWTGQKKTLSDPCFGCGKHSCDDDCYD